MYDFHLTLKIELEPIMRLLVFVKKIRKKGKKYKTYNTAISINFDKSRLIGFRLKDKVHADLSLFEIKKKILVCSKWKIVNKNSKKVNLSKFN